MLQIGIFIVLGLIIAACIICYAVKTLFKKEDVAKLKSKGTDSIKDILKDLESGADIECSFYKGELIIKIQPKNGRLKELRFKFA